MSVMLYRAFNGVFPGSLEDLVIRPEEVPNWPEGGFHPGGIIPKDPWGSQFVYISPREHGDYDLISYGADNVEGGEENNMDIVSWK